jgi:peptide subunit release factor RF-3
VVVDVANGVEKQTEKLTKVCRMRDTRSVFFVNKMDREGKDACDLLDEIEQKLSVKVTPLSWPIGMGQRFEGVYNLYEKSSCCSGHTASRRTRISLFSRIFQFRTGAPRRRIGSPRAPQRGGGG